ncbi:MAG TPA: MBL fold metallo-hydrolase [Acidimicrobiales bacterium]|nr:MBL fold metallo-hydrolase [Acidimicrobiales bacterium]
MERTLTVLGCDGSWPGPGGAASGYLVQAAGSALLLDAGPGTFANLQRWIDPGLLTAVVLTHEHPDHWTDLESLAVWAGYGPGQATFRHAGSTPLPVYAPPGLRECSHFATAGWLAWHELAPSMVLALGSLVVRMVATDHGVPTLAVHLAHEGASLAYSADSGPDWSVEELGRDIGTFLCEATYLQEAEGTLRHLSGRQAGAMARAAGVGRLILTHRWPTVSADDVRREAELAFGRPVEQATVDAVFTW